MFKYLAVLISCLYTIDLIRPFAQKYRIKIYPYIIFKFCNAEFSGDILCTPEYSRNII